MTTIPDTGFIPFRIVTNGLCYRVEQLVDSGILWWRRPRWRPLGTLDHLGYFRPKESATYKEAHQRLVSAVACWRAEAHGWTPVAPGRLPQDNGKETP